MHGYVYQNICCVGGDVCTNVKIQIALHYSRARLCGVHAHAGPSAQMCVCASHMSMYTHVYAHMLACICVCTQILCMYI